MKRKATTIYGWIAVLLIVPGLGTSVGQASEQLLYFHLHQSYEFMEAYAKGECPEAMTHIKNHLIAADSEFSGKPSVFSEPLKKIWSMYNRPSLVKTLSVENVRMEVQSAADLLGLKHQSTWHKELTICKLSH